MPAYSVKLQNTVQFTLVAESEQAAQEAVGALSDFEISEFGGYEWSSTIRRTDCPEDSADCGVAKDGCILALYDYLQDKERK